MSVAANRRPIARLAALAIGATALAGCSATTLENFLEPGATSVVQASPHPAVEPLAAGKFHFSQGNWGLAEENFRQAVEVAPGSAEAWLGLAASYDRLRRFDLADRAYAHAIELVGRNAVVLNNLGYSYLLRGEVQKARQLLLEAYEKAPADPAIRNNIALLDASAQYLVNRQP